MASSTPTSTAAHWIRTADLGPRCARLEGAHTFDVVVVGGGYTGLWTAWFLKEADASLEVAVLEQEHVGFGASGRNGGFVVTSLDHSLGALTDNRGVDAARACHLQMSRSVAAIGAFSTAHGFDCEFEPTGLLSVANAPGQVRRVEAELEAARRLGLPGFTFLDRAAVQAEIHSERFACGMFEDACAIVHPGKLVGGLKRAVLAAGVRIFEDTAVTRLEVGRKTTLHTENGRASAARVVLATNAWSNRWRPLARQQVPMFSYVLLSERLTEEQRRRIGWERRQGVQDLQNYLHYFRLTQDNRLMWGGEARYFFGASVDESHAADARAFATVERGFRRTFPQLSDLRFVDRWGGPISLTVQFVPTFGRTRGVSFGFGYCGHGVAASHTGGQVLRDLVLQKRTDLTAMFVDEAPPRFPPEPASYAGIVASRWALRNEDLRMDRGLDGEGHEPRVLRLLQRGARAARRVGEVMRRKKRIRGSE